MGEEQQCRAVAGQAGDQGQEDGGAGVQRQYGRRRQQHGDHRLLGPLPGHDRHVEVGAPPYARENRPTPTVATSVSTR
ncbi:hypothetical protein ACFQYP_27025 [Nonomuraea antimicrobica]